MINLDLPTPTRWVLGTTLFTLSSIVACGKSSFSGHSQTKQRTKSIQDVDVVVEKKPKDFPKPPREVSDGKQVANIFGSPFGSYMEDGLMSTCILLSDQVISCRGDYYNGDNDVTTTSGWDPGAKIQSYFNLEASTYIEDTKGEIWSVGFYATFVPVGRAGPSDQLIKMAFPGRHAGNKLVGISGEHQRASALFDDGQVYSWTGQDVPAPRLMAGSHTPPIKYLYNAYGHECFIDAKDDLYCQVSDPSVPGYLWTPTPKDMALSDVESLSMPWNTPDIVPDIVIRRTSGAIYTAPRYTPARSSSFKNTGVVSIDAAGNFGYAAAFGTQEFLAIDREGKLHNSSGVISHLGTTHKMVGVSYNRVNGFHHFVLTAEGKIYGAANADMREAKTFGEYSDYIMMRVFYRDICGIRSNGEVLCVGLNTKGSFESPTVIGIRK
jgi:hypothetical protein